jgi:hypothetical protein
MGLSNNHKYSYSNLNHFYLLFATAATAISAADAAASRFHIEDYCLNFIDCCHGLSSAAAAAATTITIYHRLFLSSLFPILLLPLMNNCGCC